jgi:uncharacterized protein with HEPN domain
MPRGHRTPCGVIRNTGILDEGANDIQRVEQACATQHDDIPWLVMYTMGNRVSHSHDMVDFEIDWKTIALSAGTGSCRLSRRLIDISQIRQLA